MNNARSFISTAGRLFWLVFSANLLLQPLAMRATQALDRPTPSKLQLSRSYGALPLSFEENQGQAGKDVKYLVHGSGYSIRFEDSGAALLLVKRDRPGGNRSFQKRNTPATPQATTPMPDVLQLRLIGLDSHEAVSGEARLPGTVNYFMGNDPAKWLSGIPTYERVKYSGVYPGIDLTYYGNQRRLEFDFEVAPGADPRSIRLCFDGARDLRLDKNGNLTITTAHGQIGFEKPIIYQPSGGNGRQAVEGAFRVVSQRTIEFRIGRYDHAKPLVIDPILSYSTYIGAGYATSIAVDQNGEAYVTGVANLDFPTTPGSFQPVGVPSTSYSPCDYFPECGKPFVAKFNSTGTALLYSTFISGSGIDAANGIVLDSNGDAFVVGTTSSTNFPITAGAFQTNNNASQTAGFVTELNSTGTSLVYSTYLGGSTYTSVNTVAVDASGNAYVAGNTVDANYPTTAAAYDVVQPTKAAPNSNSAFITKLNPTGSALIYSTYLGGSQLDYAYTIAVDSTGEAFVGGDTNSFNFPVTPGAIQTTREASNQDAGFVTKLNASGSALAYSTYLGGKGDDNVSAITLDSNGDAYATGFTSSTDFPVTSGAFQSTLDTSPPYVLWNAFVSELNSSGTSMVYSTFLGGSIGLGADLGFGDYANGIALDGHGMVYLAGESCSLNFPVTAGAFEPKNLDGLTDGECTAFLTKMNPAPNTPLLYSTYFGGTGNSDTGDTFIGEDANGLALDPSGNVYLAGYTVSIDFPVTPGVVETPFTGSGTSMEAFVSEFNASEMQSLPIPTVTLTSNMTSVLFGQPVTFTASVQPASGNNPPTGYAAFNFFQLEPSDDAGIGVGFGPWVTEPLNGAGVATFTTSALDYPQTPVNVFYLGDANNAPAMGTMTQALTQIPTTVTVTSSANNVPYGTPVVFTATVLDNTGKPAPGDVFFLVGDTSYAEPILDSAGQATWTNGTGGPPLPIGTDTVEAEFDGTIGYQANTGTLAETFTPLGTTPAPTFTPPAGTYDSTQFVNIDDTNVSANIYYTTDGSAPQVSTAIPFLESIRVNSSETIQAIAVVTGYAVSTVSSATYTILPPPPFSLTGTTLSLAPGATSASTITVTPSNGFTGTVTLSANVTASPAGAIDPPTLSFGTTGAVNITSASPGTATLTISTTAPTYSAFAQPRHAGNRGLAQGGAMLACLIFGLSTKCRKWRSLLCQLVSLLVLSLSMQACGSGGGGVGGGGGGGGQSNPGTTLGAYTITVIGASGALQQTTTIQLTVN